MDVRVTYVEHNCFLLECGFGTFLFDYPAEEHRPAGAEALVREAAAGKDLWVFASHGHADHFTPEILLLRDVAARSRFVLSYDIAEMHPELDPEFESEMRGVYIVEPEETYVIEGMTVRCLESTDLGVGFLLKFSGVVVYFGGDVAQWSRQGADERARRFSEEHFAATLADLAGQSVDLAFSNADPRLTSWAGGRLFVDRVRPRYFVPMHAFGDTGAVARFAAEAATAGVGIFTYASLGDTWDIVL